MKKRIDNASLTLDHGRSAFSWEQGKHHFVIWAGWSEKLACIERLPEKNVIYVGPTCKSYEVAEKIKEIAIRILSRGGFEALANQFKKLED